MSRLLELMPPDVLIGKFCFYSDESFRPNQPPNSPTLTEYLKEMSDTCTAQYVSRWGNEKNTIHVRNQILSEPWEYRPEMKERIYYRFIGGTLSQHMYNEKIKELEGKMKISDMILETHKSNFKRCLQSLVDTLVILHSYITGQSASTYEAHEYDPYILQTLNSFIKDNEMQDFGNELAFFIASLKTSLKNPTASIDDHIKSVNGWNQMVRTENLRLKIYEVITILMGSTDAITNIQNMVTLAAEYKQENANLKASREEIELALSHYRSSAYARDQCLNMLDLFCRKFTQKLKFHVIDKLCAHNN
jgi:hypothetical protein